MFFVQQFSQKIQIRHILQIPTLFNLLGEETDGSGKKPDNRRRESHLHIVRHGGDVARRQAHEGGTHRNQRTHQT